MNLAGKHAARLIKIVQKHTQKLKRPPKDSWCQGRGSHRAGRMGRVLRNQPEASCLPSLQLHSICDQQQRSTASPGRGPGAVALDEGCEKERINILQPVSCIKHEENTREESTRQRNSLCSEESFSLRHAVSHQKQAHTRAVALLMWYTFIWLLMYLRR